MGNEDWAGPPYPWWKWGIWKGPFEVNIVSESAKEIPPQEIPPESIPALASIGCFRFDDNTTQGWKLDQLYINYEKEVIDPKTRQKKTIWVHKKINPYCGFSYCNYNNLALTVEANPLIIAKSDLDPLIKANEIKKYEDVVNSDLYLESPDLTDPKYKSNWQNIKGYSIDIHRLFYSPLVVNLPQGPLMFAVQLQIRVDLVDTKTGKPKIDPVTGKPKTDVVFGEFYGTNFVFHAIDFNKPYHFAWKPPFLSDPLKTGYQDVQIIVKNVRIRITVPGYIGQGIYLSKGNWLIGNVCPEK